MKFNWGTGIAIFFILFVSGVAAILWVGMDEDVGLIAKDYYELDIHYQDRVDKLKNSNTLSKDLEVAVSDDGKQIRIVFPDEITAREGEILFLRPSDGKKDFKLSVKTTSDKIQEIPVEGLTKGLWRITIDWSDKGVAYFKETYLMI